MIDFDRITLGILAGGRASRLEGFDKALLKYSGETLLERTLRAFPRKFCERLLSYNRIADAGMAGVRIVPDLRADFPGPLAALEALASACRSPWLLTVPVDCRDIPDSLADTLAGGVGHAGAVVRDVDGLQPLFALWRVEVLRVAVVTAIDSNELAAHKLVSRLDLRVHDISPHRLGNLNTPADFAAP